jgi:glycosyltransferase involved in cell wall biosynthesis
MLAANQISDRKALDWGILFTVLISLSIVVIGVWLTNYELAAPDPEMGGFFYEWQLANPTFWSRATAWVGYALHNLLIWGTIYWAQERSSRQYTGTLKPVNLIALGINGVFIVLHLLQTLFFYDGIAQDLPSWTAQFTVIMMLFVIMMMENRRRGMFFGKKLNFRKEFYDWLKRYHGYAFSFAVIYTFWFHPMVPTIGHIVGFAYVIFVMLQGSLMFTKVHVNRKWIFLNEILVLPHAAFVAINQGGGIVYMFLFGFLTIFIVTQMHGLGLKPWIKNLFYAGYILTILLTYTILREPFMVNEVIRIPLIDYLMIFMTYGLWWLFARFTGGFDAAKVQQQQIPAAGD